MCECVGEVGEEEGGGGGVCCMESVSVLLQPQGGHLLETLALHLHVHVQCHVDVYMYVCIVANTHSFWWKHWLH